MPPSASESKLRSKRSEIKRSSAVHTTSGPPKPAADTTPTVALATRSRARAVETLSGERHGGQSDSRRSHSHTAPSAPTVTPAIVGTPCRHDHASSPSANPDTSRTHRNAFDRTSVIPTQKLVSPQKSHTPVHRAPNPTHSEPLPEINIAVCGQPGVGKTSFIRSVLDLPELPAYKSAERRFSFGDTLYLLRLLEFSTDEIDTDEDGFIEWPDTIEDRAMPRVHGALSLYDVQDKSSIQELRDILSAITKSSLPTVLVACKCDTPPAKRELDPAIIEQNARRVNKTIIPIQVSDLNPASHKRGMSMLLQAIVKSTAFEESSAIKRATSVRQRAHTAASPSRASTATLGHSRASSDHTVIKDSRHSRVDSSFPAYAAGDRLRVPQEGEQMQGSFLFEESGSESSSSSARSSLSEDAASIIPGASQPSELAEQGATFDELVDRLLDQPASKSDLKFAATFLAIYRKFAAPGKLLEAVVERFDAVEQNGEPVMTKSTAQLRYLAVIDKWVHTYPGDFAFPKTQRRLRTFAHKVSENRVFAVAAREISIALEAVSPDDDTDWACNDKDREASGETSRSSMASSVSTLIDDPEFSFDRELSGTTLFNDIEPPELPKVPNQMTVYVEQAQRCARELQPIPRTPLTKIQWRALMDQPDDAIAKELTRIDWIMFSATRPRDLVRYVSMTKQQKAGCRNQANVDRQSEHFNQVAFWVANYVLLRDKPKHRVLMLEKFMRIARKLRELNNYNGLGAVIAGVKSTAVHRLSATRELLPPSVGKDWLKLEILMAPSRSHFAYRLAWENSSSERIPYLPLHRRDLAAAEEGNRTFLGDESDGRINWKKFEIMGDVIVSLQRAQGMPYKNLGGPKGNELVKELLLEVKLVKEEEDLYERSVQCEPPANAVLGPSAKFKEFFKR